MKLSANLLKRLVSAAVLAPLAVGAFLAGGVWWTGLLAIIAGLMAVEWFRIIGNISPTVWGVFFGAVFALFIKLNFASLVLVALVATPALYSQKRHKTLCLLAGPTIALPLLSLHAVGIASPLALLWLVLVIWATDAFAMLIGRTFGGPKLAPRLSPKKTWSGLAGGVGGGLMATALLLVFTALPASFLIWAPAFSILAQAGDLTESALKRRFAVKDSGNIIPGHGGVLDRMDSFLLTGPALWLLLQTSMMTFPL